MGNIQVKVTSPILHNGELIKKGATVNVDEQLAERWFKADSARPVDGNNPSEEDIEETLKSTEGTENTGEQNR